MAGGALVGLSYVTSMSAFYFFYTFNALGYVFGGPLPNQVLLSRWFDRAAARRWGLRTSVSASAARWCRCWRLRSRRRTAGAARFAFSAC